MSNRTPEQWRARAEGLERSLDALQREHARIKRQRQELADLLHRTRECLADVQAGLENLPGVVVAEVQGIREGGDGA